MIPAYIPSINLPSSSSTSSAPSRPPRALLAASEWNADLRRAGCELITRLTKPKPRHRHTKSEPTARLGQLERMSSRPQPKVELHILILSKTRMADDDEAEARSIITEVFRRQDASVRVHVASHRRSMLVTTSTVKSSLHRAMQEDTQLGKVLQGGLAAAGLVLGEEQMEGDEGSLAFMEELAGVFQGLAIAQRTTPSITLFLPRQDLGLGAFDFDLDDPLAERLARSAAHAFTTSLARPETPRPAPPTARSRRHSDLGLPSLRPLLLRPAPGPGAQSVSLRLAIAEAQDVILRVSEAQTPITLSSSSFARPSADTIEDASTRPTPDPPLPSIHIPVLSRARSPSQLPRLCIPSPTPKSPNLVSSFSPTSSEGTASPQTPHSTSGPHSGAATPFDRLLFTPLCKISAETEAEGEDSPASALDSPWTNVHDLLKRRVDSADQRRTKDDGEVMFEAPEMEARWSRA